MKILAKHLPYDDGHLSEVVVDMRSMGPPKIKTVEYKGHLIALEGSHRLAACKILNMTPILEIVKPDVDWPDYAAFWNRAVEILPEYTFE